jgi:hypothetical protein
MPSFTDLLNQYSQRLAYKPSQLARLSGLPRRTIANWLEGTTIRPRALTDVLKLAQTLHLNRAEADELLQTAAFPPIIQLQAQPLAGPEQELLAFWTEAQTPLEKQLPFQAVRDLPTFVGRETLLETVQEQLLADHHTNIYVLEGMAGVGKTVLAARLAYRLRPHLPDGVLWARLDLTPPMAALQLFAEAYGRDVTAYDDLGSRGAAIRELLAEKRALLVLDYVSSSQEIEPLLPPSGACAVLITTRHTDLAVSHGAVRYPVEPFSLAEAETLLATILGEEVVLREQAALREMAQLLGNLPLALDVAACRLAHESDVNAANLLARLRDGHNRLDELVYGERSVRAALETSYALLPPAQQGFLAALHHFDGGDFSAETAASITNIPVETAETYLRDLFSLSLVRRGRPSHFRLIPFLQSFAREKAANNLIG